MRDSARSVDCRPSSRRIYGAGKQFGVFKALQKEEGKSALRVVASCFEPDTTQSIEGRLQSLEVHLCAILKEQCPDLTVLPEMALVPDISALPNCGTEPLDGPTVSLCRKLAAAHGATLIVPIVEDDHGAKYNTAVFVDRSGRVAGKYRKQMPTSDEMSLGILPGDSGPDPVVVDGLRVGTAICYDENYPDFLWNWLSKRVDLLVFPSYTYGGKLIGAWALYCGVPLVCAFPWQAVIYDRDGSILAEGGSLTPPIRAGHHPPWIACDVNMESRAYHLDGNQEKVGEMQRRYDGKLDIRLAVGEARMYITVRSSDLEIGQVEQEMGLVGWQDYVLGTRAQADRLRRMK